MHGHAFSLHRFERVWVLELLDLRFALLLLFYFHLVIDEIRFIKVVVKLHFGYFDGAFLVFLDVEFD